MTLCMITFIDKFNSTVPGIFQLNDTNVSSDPSEIHNNKMITTSSVHSVLISTTEVPIFVVSDALLYMVIGVSGGIIILAFSSIIVCVLIRYSVRRKRKSHTCTIAATLQAHNGMQTQGMI